MPGKSPSEKVKEIFTKMAFAPENLEKAAAENSALFLDAMEYRLECLENRAKAKLEYERLHAEKDLKTRKYFRENDTKITEGQIDAILSTDKDIIKASESLSHAETLEEYSKLLIDALRMRRDCLRIVADLVRNELAIERATGIGAEAFADTRRKLRERYPKGGV